MPAWLGDYKEDDTLHFLWTTNGQDGASITRSTNGEVRVYKDNDVVQSTAGITDTEDFDGLTGVHACTIDLSADAFYAIGADYTVVLQGAVVDTKTVNSVLAHFSIENRFNEVTVTSIGNDVITAAAVDDDGSFVVGALSVTNQLDAGNVVVDSTAAVTGEVSIGNGIVVTCSTGGKSAAKLTGGAASGIGIEVIGTGTGQGVIATGGGTSGTGVAIVGGNPNGPAFYMKGAGSGSGFRADGGDGEGVGVIVNGGLTNGNAITINKAGSGYDIDTDIHGTIDTTTTATNVTTLNGIANAVITAASIATGAIDSDAMAASANEEIADAVWDEVLTAATHNVASSAGRRLRTLDSNEMRAGTCQAGSTANTIRLDAAASAVDGWYDPAVVIIDGGTGAGQCRLVIDYVGATQTCVVNRDWRLTPDITSTFIVVADSGLDAINEGQAAGGAASSITLNTHAKNINDTYNGCTVVLTSGTGRGQTRIIIDYDGGTKVALISEPWVTQPIAGTGYYIFGYGRSHLIPDSIDDVWDELIAGHLGAGTVGATLNSASAPTVDQIADAVWNEDATGHVAANSAGNYIRAAYALATGRLRIDDVAKQLILFMPDGVTEVARWNIYNNAGALASTNVFDRQRT